MQKHEAIKLLGGSYKKAAAAMDLTYQAVYRWPDPLSKNIEDRVQWALSKLPKRRAKVEKK